ncbi:MAG: RHS repeat-associated core domain-containing protein [Armatimonadota bacterium]
MKIKKRYPGILWALVILPLLLFLIFTNVVNSQTDDSINPYLNIDEVPEGVIDISSHYNQDENLDYKGFPSIVNSSVFDIVTVDIMGYGQRFSSLASYGPTPSSPMYQGGHAYYSLRLWPYFVRGKDTFVYLPKVINYKVEFRNDNNEVLIKIEGTKKVEVAEGGIWMYGFYEPSKFKDKIGTGRYRMYYEIWFPTTPDNIMKFDLQAFTDPDERTRIAKSHEIKDLKLSSRGGYSIRTNNSEGRIKGDACMGTTAGGGKGSGGGDNNGGCPVSIATGALVEEYVDMSFPSGYEIRRYYNSGMGYQPGGGSFGWMFNFDECLRFDSVDGSIYYRDFRFCEYRFVKKPGDNRRTYSPAQPWNFLKVYYDLKNYIVIFPDQSKKVFNTLGFLIKEIDPQGRVTTYTWKMLVKDIRKFISDMPIEIASIMGVNRNLCHDMIITDPYGRKINVYHDDNGLVSKIQDWTGRTVEYTWRDGLFLSKVKDVEGNYTVFKFDGGKYSTIEYPNGSQVYNDYMAGHPPDCQIVREQRLANGGYIKYKYSWIQPAQDFNPGNIVTYKSLPVPASGEMWTEINESGRIVRFYYDDRGNITRTEEPGPNGQRVSYAFTYDPATQLMTSKKDPLGRITKYYYDNDGNIIKFVRPDNTEIRIVYNNRNYPTDYYDAMGGHVSFYYDSKNNLVSYVDKCGKKWVFDYNNKSNMTRLTDPNGHVWKYDYDSRGNLVSMVDEEGGFLYAKYNDMGMPVFININGRKYDYTYNNFNLLTEIKDPEGNATKFTYDGNCNLTSVTDAENNTVRMAYDAFNLLRRVTDAETFPVSLNYNHNEKLTDIRDPRENNINFGYPYNHADKVISKRDQLNRYTYYSYDGAGNLLARRVPSTPLNVEYRYDQLNRLIRKTGDNTIYYDWDDNSNLMKVRDETGSTEYEYDAMGRLIKKEYPFKDKSTELRYDNAGNLIYQKNFAGDEFSIEYDKANKITAIKKKGDKDLKLVYNENKDPARIDYPNGMKLFIVYNGLKNISRMKYLSDKGEILYLVEYEYDKLNRVKRKKSWGSHRNAKDFEYVYDKVGQLKEVKLAGKTVSSYAYDRNGNRISSQTPSGRVDYKYDDANQLKSTSNTRYDYDSAGNIMAADTSGRKKDFYYNKLNKVKKIEFKGPGSESFEEYTYSGATGLRTVKYSSKTKEKIYTLWLNGSIKGEIDENGKIEFVNYGYGFSNPKGNYYYITDLQGSVVGVTDKEGEIAAIYEYDEFGNPLTSVSGTPGEIQGQPQQGPHDSQQESGNKENKLISFIKKIFDNIKKFFMGHSPTERPNQQNTPAVQPQVDTKGAPPLPQLQSRGAFIAAVQTNNLGPQDDDDDRDPLDRPGHQDDNQTPLPDPPGGERNQTPLPDPPDSDRDQEPGPGGQSQEPGFVNKVESPIRYAGYYYDEESELYYLQSRYYDPKIGRFTQPDKIGYAAGLNLYVYCDNDPVNFVDPEGYKQHYPTSGTPEYQAAMERHEARKRTRNESLGQTRERISREHPEYQSETDFKQDPDYRAQLERCEGVGYTDSVVYDLATGGKGSVIITTGAKVVKEAVKITIPSDSGSGSGSNSPNSSSSCSKGGADLANSTN